jgi:hypothetical protein
MIMCRILFLFPDTEGNYYDYHFYYSYHYVINNDKETVTIRYDGKNVKFNRKYVILIED